MTSQSGDDPSTVRHPDGHFLVFGTCKNAHHCLAEVEVSDGVFEGIRLLDVEGDAGVELAGGFRLWRVPNARYCVSNLQPSSTKAVLPAVITALGHNTDCIVATKRPSQGGSVVQDEWWLIDVTKAEVDGPFDDAGLAAALQERGLREPEVLQLPEEVTRRW
jgi:hypothetical protein